MNSSAASPFNYCIIDVGSFVHAFLYTRGNFLELRVRLSEKEVESETNDPFPTTRIIIFTGKKKRRLRV